jgi:hypothetical protein
MNRYYFDVREGGHLTADAEGEELSDIAAVEREAALAAIHLAKERLIRPGSLTVEVRNDKGMPVVRANLSLDVARVSSSDEN